MVLPFFVAGIVIFIVVSRSPDVPAGLRTSSLLADGEPATGELLDWKVKSTVFMDRRPMVAMRIAVRDAGELNVTQAIPRPLLAALQEGMTLDLRLSPDGAAAAVIFPTPDVG